MMPKPLTIRHIVRTVNLTRLTHPIYYEVKNETVRKNVDLGKAGEPPEKRGWPPRIPDALLEACNIHVTGMQASVDISEANKSIMMDTIDSIVQGTGFEGTIIMIIIIMYFSYESSPLIIFVDLRRNYYIYKVSTFTPLTPPPKKNPPKHS